MWGAAVAAAPAGRVSVESVEGGFGEEEYPVEGGFSEVCHGGYGVGFVAGAVGEYAHGAEGDDGAGAAGGDHGEVDAGDWEEADDVAHVDEGLGDDTGGEGGGSEGEELVGGAGGNAESDVGEPAEQADDKGAAHESHFFADDGEDEVVFGFGEVEPFGAGLAESYPGEGAVGEGEESLVGLEGGGFGVGEVAEECADEGVEAFAAEATGEKNDGESDGDEDAEAGYVAHVDAGEEEEGDDDEKEGHGHAEVAFGEDEGEHGAGNGEEFHEGGVDAVEAGFVAGEDVGTPEGDGDAGDFGGLEPEGAEGDPGLGAFFGKSGADAGDEDEDEEEDGAPEEDARETS